MADTVAEIKKVMLRLSPAEDPGYGKVWFNTATGMLRYSLSDSDEQDKYEEWDSAFNQIDGVTKVDGDAEVGAPKGPEWVECGKVRPSFESVVESLYGYSVGTKE